MQGAYHQSRSQGACHQSFRGPAISHAWGLPSVMHGACHQLFRGPAISHAGGLPSLLAQPHDQSCGGPAMISPCPSCRPSVIHATGCANPPSLPSPLCCSPTYPCRPAHTLPTCPRDHLVRPRVLLRPPGQAQHPPTPAHRRDAGQLVAHTQGTQQRQGAGGAWMGAGPGFIRKAHNSVRGLVVRGCGSRVHTQGTQQRQGAGGAWMGVGPGFGSLTADPLTPDP